ncbi:hypothetical protein [Paenibacillus dakarensis]|uniref:hypothetical protein n=1 Tax=Paenibacillus dakarensis TaxID=1527293 RepID=UPI0006D56B79|nr:hypothetical protein [Paenibacillus dakarensis]
MKKGTIVAGIVVLIIVGMALGDEDSSNTDTNVVSQSDVIVQEKQDSSPVVTDKEEVETEELTAYVDVNQIARKSKEEVDKILGEPVKVEKFDFEMGPEFKSYPVTFAYYLEMLEGEMGRVEIMYVEGGAHRIQVNLVGDEYYKGDERYKNLPYAGLPETKLNPPVTDIQKAHFKENIFGFFRVTAADWMLTENGNVEIITEEKYK